MTTATRKRRKPHDAPSSEEQLLADLIQLLEGQPLPPWRKPWAGQAGSHRNLLTRQPYRGVNPLLLEMGLLLRNQRLPLWLGASQARAKGWFPRKGSKGVRILRPQLHERHQLDSEGQPLRTAEGQPLMLSWVSYRAHALFHVQDLQGRDDAAQQALEAAIAEAVGQPSNPEPQARLEAAEAVLEAWPVETRWHGTEAFYSPGPDRITLPPAEAFTSREALCATWAHEQAHSTGHSSRLNRDLSGSRQTAAYAREELVAELASVLICCRLQIGCELEGHASYLQHWSQLLRDGGAKGLLAVLSDARRAADQIAPEAPGPDSE